MSSEITKPVNLPLELALLVFLSAVWATSYTFIKIGVATIPPITLIATRTLIAGIALLAVMRMRGIRMPLGADIWRRFLFQACLNSAVPFTLIAWAEQSVDADLAVILNSTTPIFTFLMTIFITKHERVTFRHGFGIAAGLAGVTLIVGVGAFDGLGREIGGQLAIVAATICYAGAAIFGRTFKGVNSMVPAAGSLLAGAAILIPISLVVDHPWTLAPSLASGWALIGLAILSTALPFVIYFRLMQTLGPVRATSQAFLRVPFGVAIGSFALGETLSWTSWIGFVSVIVGVGAMTIGPVSGLRAVSARPVAFVRAIRKRHFTDDLLVLDDRMLRDIGLTRCDVASTLVLPLTIDPTGRLAGLASERWAGQWAQSQDRLAPSSQSDYLSGSGPR